MKSFLLVSMMLSFTFAGFAHAEPCKVDLSGVRYSPITGEIRQIAIDQGCEVSSVDPDFKITLGETCFLYARPTTPFQKWAQEHTLQRAVTVNVTNLRTGQIYRIRHFADGLRGPVNRRMGRRILRSVVKLLDRAIQDSQ